MPRSTIEELIDHIVNPCEAFWKLLPPILQDDLELVARAVAKDAPRFNYPGEICLQETSAAFRNNPHNMRTLLAARPDLENRDEDYVLHMREVAARSS